MKYTLMIIGDEEVWEARSPEEIAQVMAKHGAVTRALDEAGKNVGGHRLCRSHEAVTLRVREHGLEQHDGPYAETKEQLGGFYLIEADSQQEAIDWARQLPNEPGARIEVRPCRTGAQWRGPVQGKQRYLLLLIGSDETTGRQTRDQVFASIDQHYELSLELAAQGRFVGSRSLGMPTETSTLCDRDGEVVLMDGPFAETKEAVVGYFVVSCDTREDALGVAERLSFGLAAVEVRPVRETP